MLSARKNEGLQLVMFKSWHMCASHFCFDLISVLAFHIWVGIYSYYTELEDKLMSPPDFQLENLAFQKESDLEYNSTSDAQTPLAKEFNHAPVPV
jgi:hypothetical protein